MKTLSFIVLLTLSTTCLPAYGQTQKKAVECTQEEFCTVISKTLESLQEVHDIQWIYTQLALVDSSSLPTNTSPPPPFLGYHGYSEINLNRLPCIEVELMNEFDFPLFTDVSEDTDSLLRYNQEHIGTGLLFSEPYMFKGDSTRYMDVEILDWDGCGTDKVIPIALPTTKE